MTIEYTHELGIRGGRRAGSPVAVLEYCKGDSRNESN